MNYFMLNIYKFKKENFYRITNFSPGKTDPNSLIEIDLCFKTPSDVPSSIINNIQNDDRYVAVMKFMQGFDLFWN